MSEIHPLRRWLFEHQETMADFADRIGVSQSYLSEIVNEKKRPKLELIDKITIATDRSITANDFQRIESATPPASVS